MTRNIIALIGFALLAGCSGGGGDSAAPGSAPAPLAQPDMLTATPQGILRGKANGQGQHFILAKSNIRLSFVTVSQDHVLYPYAGDIWTVRTDGTGDHAVLNTPDREFIATVNGLWLIYGKDARTSGGSFVTSYGSINVETGAQFPFDDGEGTLFMNQNAARIISTTSQRQISSLTVTGSDRLTYASLTPDEQLGGGTFLKTVGIVGNVLIYSKSASLAPSTFYSRTSTIPLAGGTPTLLDEERYDTFSAWSVGNRIVYHRMDSFPARGQNDVLSIQKDGSNRVVLTTDPANEAVQGVVGNEVIIRRNLSGNDQLVAVPVTGGQERILMTMTDSEFVQLVVGDLLILRRPTGTWSLDLNGTLTKLGTVVGDSGFIAVGDSVCMTKVTAVWCMPLDGAGPQVKIADEGWVFGVL